MLTRTIASVAIALSIVAPAFAESDAASSSSSRPVKYDGACMSSAVDKRDTAVVTAFDTFSASLKTALTTRKDALKAGWSQTSTDARKSALKAAWQTFQQSQKSAREAFRKSKQAAWKQFKTDAKTCKANTSEEGGSAETGDVSL
jgi:hypothetical protein